MKTNVMLQLILKDWQLQRRLEAIQITIAALRTQTLQR